MIQTQTVSGFFDDAAEAQQAIQGLLGNGFGAADIDISVQPTPTHITSSELAQTVDERNSGRFLTALFGAGSPRPTQLPAEAVGTDGTKRGSLVTVQVHPPHQTAKVVALLKGANAVHVTDGTRDRPGATPAKA